MTTALQIETIPELGHLGRSLSEALSEDALKVPSAKPTPLIGSWADESWPLNSRQASEIVAEQALQRQRSSIMFEDASTEGTVEEVGLELDVDDLHTQEGLQSELEEQFSDAYTYQATEPSTSPSHVARCYTHDPYSINTPYVLIHACYCDRCAIVHQRVSSEETEATASFEQHHERTSSYPPVAPSALGASPLSSGTHASFSAHTAHHDEWDAPRPAPRSEGFRTHTTSSTVPAARHYAPMLEKPMPQEEELVELSSFMPPAPPPRIACLVFQEEGTRNPSGVYYHILMRWYSRVVQSQHYFVAEADACPAPDKQKYSFEEWADQVSGWWYTHFENMQKKAVSKSRRY